MVFEVKVSVVEGPIFKGRAREEGGFVCEVGESM